MAERLQVGQRFSFCEDTTSAYLDKLPPRHAFLGNSVPGCYYKRECTRYVKDEERKIKKTDVFVVESAFSSKAGWQVFARLVDDSFGVHFYQKTLPKETGEQLMDITLRE